MLTLPDQGLHLESHRTRWFCCFCKRTDVMQAQSRTLTPCSARHREVFYCRVGLGGTLIHPSPLLSGNLRRSSSVSSWICLPRPPFPCAWDSILSPFPPFSGVLYLSSGLSSFNIWDSTEHTFLGHSESCWQSP